MLCISLASVVLFLAVSARSFKVQDQPNYHQNPLAPGIPHPPALLELPGPFPHNDAAPLSFHENECRHPFLVLLRPRRFLAGPIHPIADAAPVMGLVCRPTANQSPSMCLPPFSRRYSPFLPAQRPGQRWTSCLAFEEASRDRNASSPCCALVARSPPPMLRSATRGKTEPGHFPALAPYCVQPCSL